MGSLGIWADPADSLGIQAAIAGSLGIQAATAGSLVIFHIREAIVRRMVSSRLEKKVWHCKERKRKEEKEEERQRGRKTKQRDFNPASASLPLKQRRKPAALVKGVGFRESLGNI